LTEVYYLLIKSASLYSTAFNLLLSLF